MAFYQLAVTILGIIFMYIGFLMLFRSKSVIKYFNPLKYNDLKMYVKYFGLIQLFGGTIFLSIGICMHFFELRVVYEVVSLLVIGIIILLIKLLDKKYKK